MTRMLGAVALVWLVFYVIPFGKEALAGLVSETAYFPLGAWIVSRL